MPVRNIPILLAALCLCFPAAAAARLGDTEQEAISRYGMPTRQEQAAGFDKKLTFDSLPYTISVLLKGGRVAAISYQQADKGKISLSRIERLLRYNGERENEPEGMELKNVWYLDGGTPGLVRLRDKAEQTEAIYEQGTNTLTVRTLPARTAAPAPEAVPPKPKAVAKTAPAKPVTAKPAAAVATKTAPGKTPGKPTAPAGRQAAAGNKKP